MTLSAVLRPMLVCLALLVPIPVLAQQALPAERFVYSRDSDFPGGDLSQLFDTTLEACARACRADSRCGAFTFNARGNACFPKSGAFSVQPFAGAISAVRVPTAAGALARLPERLAALSFLQPADFEAALELVDTVARRHPAGGQTAGDFAAALAQAVGNENWANARVLAGFLASAGDSAAAWTALSSASLRLPEGVPSAVRRDARREAIPAALNGALRAESPAQEAMALAQLAEALEEDRRGADMIPALRRAITLSGRADLTERLDRAIAQYGFRVTAHQVDSDAAAPRICANFSEPLDPGIDYAPFLRVPQGGLVPTAQEAQLCLDGAVHGESYDVTFRSGLPAASGETLARDVSLRLYVRDRSPAVRFPGRAYILPRLDGAGLPVVTVNADRIDLILRRVSDRNLLRSLQQDYFGRPLSAWEAEIFDAEIAAEVWTGAAEVQTELNREMTTRLPLGEMLSGHPPGIYVLQARLPDPQGAGQPAAMQWFVLSDLGLTTMAGADGLHVAVRGLSDAAARQGVRVQLVSQANAVLGEALSDAEGFARFEAGLVRGDGAARPALIVAEVQDDMTFLTLDGPAFDLSDRGVEGRPSPGPIDAFLATDRGAYRTGETIGVTALLRDDRGAALTGLPLTAILSRPDGAEYTRMQAEAAADGGHVFRMPLGHDVPRGAWRLDLRLGQEGAPLASETVLVEDFLPERIELTMALPDGPLVPRDMPTLQVQADYLFGAPAADLPLEGDIRLRPMRILADWPGFVFGPEEADGGVRFAALEPARTDASGAARLAMPFPEIDAAHRPLEAEIVARISEGSGRPVERRETRAVQGQGPLVGLRPLFEEIVPEGAEAAFEVVALSADGAARVGAVDWVLNRIETRYQWYQLYGQWNWEPSTRRIRVGSGSLTLGTAPGRIAAPVEWGEYELVAVLADSGGALATTRFTAGWFGTGGDGADTPDRLPVSLDRPAYQPGDTATLRIDAPSGGTALVSVLSHKVIHREVVTLPTGDSAIPLQVTEDWGTGAYVAASLLRPVGTDDPAPARALGIAHAVVAPGERALTVEIDAPETVDGQEGAVDVVLRVAGSGDGPAHVTLAAVDLGVLNLTGHAPPDPQGHYFGQRRLGVELRDLYSRLIDGQSGAMGRVRSGGDSGAAQRLQAPPPTEAPMIFFSGLVPVGPDGAARIRVPKPAFNGTIRLDAIAWSARGVGQASARVVARDPVVMTASLPRFLAPGDQSRLLLEFVPTEGTSGELSLGVTAAGVTTGAVPASVTVRPGQRTLVDLPVSADAVGDHEITVTLGMQDGTVLIRTLMLGVRRNDPETATTRRFTLAPGQTFRFDGEVLAGLVPGTGGATLTAGPLARFDVPGLLSQLDRYPYGCTEQLTSVALPMLYLSHLAPEADMGDRVADVTQRILARQSSSGGFGLWTAGSGELWLDAYVTDFLIRARNAGIAVPDRALRLALENLQNQVNYGPDFDNGGEGLAYALLVLAAEGAASMADLRYYADVKREALATPRAAAELGAALASYGDTLRADRMFAHAGAMLGSDTGAARVWRPDYGSGLADAAAVLRLATVSGSAVVDRSALAVRLTPERPLSTQEIAQVLLTVDALGTVPGASGLEVNGVPASGLAVLRLDHAERGEVRNVRNTGSDVMDVTLTTFGVPEVPPPAGGYGYALSRAYFTPDGAPLAGPVTAGDQLVAVLTVTPFEETGARLMLEDPLPAGLEIENPNLVQSGQIRGLDWLEPAPVQHAEFRADRFRVALDVRGTEPVQVAYKLRAVSPGSYHHPAAMVHDMYRPEYRAVTQTGRWTVVR